MKIAWSKCLYSIVSAGLLSLAMTATPLLASNQPMDGTIVPNANMVYKVYRAADSLEDHILYTLNRTKPIIVTSFVDFNHFDESSSFGRLISDLFATRLAQHGYKIIEFRLRKEKIVVNDEGEFALSRDLFELSESQSAQAIIVGTYAVNGSNALISVKMLDSDNGAMIATHAFNLPVRQLFFPPERALRKKLEETDIEAKTAQEVVAKPAPGALETATILLDLKRATDAKLVQHRLLELKLYNGKIDGKWGPKSKAALSNFAMLNNLGAAGKWNAAVQKALFNGTGR